MLVFDERHEVHVVLASDDENALAGVSPGIGFGCSRMSSRSPRSKWKTMSWNPMPRSALSFAFFASSQAKYFTATSVAQRVPTRHTLASSVD